MHISPKTDRPPASQLFKKALIPLLLSLIILFVSTPSAMASDTRQRHVSPTSAIEGLAQIGMAYITHIVIHETGHAAIANHVGADGISMEFLTNSGGNFFLGMSNVTSIDEDSILPYSVGGEFAANLTFEYALQDFRREPSLFNKSLLLFSGTDFLMYSLYAFYMTDGNPSYDPIIISETTGLSKDVVFSAALLQTILNAQRLYSGHDRIIPYITLDRYSAIFNLKLIF